MDEGTRQKDFWHYEMNGIPLYLYICFAAAVFIGMATGSLGTDLLSTMGMLFVIGMFFMQVGRRLPIWNKWIGGGSMMAIMAPSFLVWMGWIPEKYVQSATLFYSDSYTTAGGAELVGMNFLELYLGLLMVGGLLAVERDTLVKTLKRCGPVFFGTIAVAGMFGLGAGMLFGKSPADSLAYYILPNLGGGNGAGAVPMSEIFEQVTGNPKEEYYATALAILTLGSTIALVMGVCLNRIGEIFPALTGDKTQLLRSAKEDLKEGKQKEAYKPNATDIGTGIVTAGAFWALASIFGEFILPEIGGVIIHPYAYLIIFVTIANVFKLIPQNLTQGAKALSKFVTGTLGPMCFAGMGIAITDFGEFVAAITWENFFVTFMIILGVALGAALLGWVVGFYPIDSAIIVGLCCANRGGSADVVLLGATERMELMPYAQVLSRLGGAIVLAMSSAIFAVMF